MFSIKQSLIWANQQLKKSGIESHGLDAEVLLSFVLKITKEKLYAHLEQKLNGSQFATYNKLIKRRAKREPAAYLTGHKEFYGLDFLVNKKILIPRPETELMAEEVIKKCRMQNAECRIIDIGTGSGCIIITLAKLLTTNYLSRRYGRDPDLTSGLRPKFFATDISPTALKLARQNARRHGVEKQIKFLQGDLLKPILKICNHIKNLEFHNSQFRNLILTANLPYLPTAEWRRTPPDVKKYEPHLALDGGPDGLKYYRQLFQQIKKLQTTNYKLPTTHLLCEICPHQTNKISTIAKHYFPKCQIKIKKDLCGHKRLAIIILKTH